MTVGELAAIVIPCTVSVVLTLLGAVWAVLRRLTGIDKRLIKLETQAELRDEDKLAKRMRVLERRIDLCRQCNAAQVEGSSPR
jgi:hypothetical protein